jgi:hypothetical protein
MKRSQFYWLIVIIWTLILITTISEIIAQYHWDREVISDSSYNPTLGFEATIVSLIAWRLFWGVFSTALLFNIVKIDTIPNYGDE